MSDPATTSRFAGRTAMVTGAGRGIGSAIAQGFADGGATVVVCDIDGSAAESVADGIRQRGGVATSFEIDVTSAEQARSLARYAQEQTGSVDILVNNAALTTNEIIEETDETAWRRVLDVNLTGPFLCAKAVLPYMRSQQYGKIVNVASVAAKRISFNSGASYTASKAGLVAFTRHLAYEAAPDGINVNAVCPGPVLTPMMKQVASEETLSARRKSIPAGRFPTPEDQTDVVLYLASDQAAMVIGQAVDVDGGALLGWYDTSTYFIRRGASRVDAERV